MRFGSKVKEILKDKNTPITADKARMIAITGSVCTMEQRLQSFIKEVNKIIADKVRFQEFYHMVVIPEDLISYRDAIIADFQSRKFAIYTVTPENKEIFVISWKY